jgi:hypothetical protein
LVTIARMPERGRKTTTHTSFLDQVGPPLDQAGLDRAIVACATPQHGVLSLAQLVELGMAPSTVRGRAKTGRLHRIHRGVYSLVPEQLLSRYGRWMAAVLACGPRAVLSHRTAAALHGLRGTNRANIEVSVACRSGRKHDRIEVHRTTTLTRGDVTEVEGIPCTSVARTLLDLAAVVPRRGVERAFDQAEIEGMFDLRAIDRQLERNPKHPGIPVVKSILAEHYIGTTPTVSELEEAFLTLCRRIGVPDPRVNEWVDLRDGEEPIWADFVWHKQRVIVETDGHKFHNTQQARERDPRRDQRAVLAGWTPIRTTWRQVMNRPRELEPTIVRLVGVPVPLPPSPPGATA